MRFRSVHRAFGLFFQKCFCETLMLNEMLAHSQIHNFIPKVFYRVRVRTLCRPPSSLTPNSLIHGSYFVRWCWNRKGPYPSSSYRVVHMKLSNMSWFPKLEPNCQAQLLKNSATSLPTSPPPNYTWHSAVRQTRPPDHQK